MKMLTLVLVWMMLSMTALNAYAGKETGGDGTNDIKSQMESALTVDDMISIATRLNPADYSVFTILLLHAGPDECSNCYRFRSSYADIEAAREGR